MYSRAPSAVSPGKLFLKISPNRVLLFAWLCVVGFWGVCVCMFGWDFLNPISSLIPLVLT